MKRETVILGDWSNDGHNRTETFIIEVADNVNTDAALDAAFALFGFNMDNYCEEYEDNEFPSDLIRRIHAEANFRGIDTGLMFEPEDLQEDNVYLGYDEFFDLWRAYLNVGIVMLYGTETALATHVEGQKEHHIGGYGLFS